MSGSNKKNRRRPAFSLVELMVAMALTLFIMVVLTQAFVTSLETFSGLKSVGELQAQLRTIRSVLITDLQYDHFEAKRRLSSPDLLTTPPCQGFFCIYQGSAPMVAASPNPYIVEGNESTLGTSQPAGLYSWRATNHVLYFTIKLRGNRPDSYMTASLPSTGSPLSVVPPNFFSQSRDAEYIQPNNAASPATYPNFVSSQWAEVCYFLVQTGSNVDPANPSSTEGTPLYALYRAQYLLVPNTSYANTAANQATFNMASSGYPNLSISQSTAGTIQFNAPDDVITPSNRTLYPPNGNPNGNRPYPTRQLDSVPSLGTPPNGAALVLSNVTSFQVQVFTQQSGLSNTNTPFPPGPDFTDVAASLPGTFDSSVPLSNVYSPPGNPYNVLAVKVTIRIWDSASQMSRQVTIVQDM